MLATAWGAILTALDPDELEDELLEEELLEEELEELELEELELDELELLELPPPVATQLSIVPSALLPAPWKPNATELPTGILPFQFRLVAVYGLLPV